MSANVRVDDCGDGDAGCERMTAMISRWGRVYPPTRHRGDDLRTTRYNSFVLNRRVCWGYRPIIDKVDKLFNRLLALTGTN